MYTQIYTDASRSEEGVAAAFVTSNSSHKFKVNKFGSIYNGELFAILQALKHILEYDIQNSSVITDSLSAIIGIQQMYSDNQILINIKEAIYAISRENKNIIFLWVPSHVGIRGNELADKAAREALRDQNINFEEELEYGDQKAYFKKLLKDSWNSRWQNSQSKLKEVKSTIKPWKITPQNRSHQVVLTRLRIGHTRYTHGQLLKKEEVRLCDRCLIPMSVKHFLVECPKFSAQRQAFNLDPDLSSILGENCKISNLVNYLNDIEVLKDL
ncbi:uncharacterized protein [Leptinotarsa decemlineata]|uniref:uncharacterized protein n=1 Tax=Leptinotarsa decemlineata TaxID=7539 RepID=UPI003D30549D